MHVILLSDLLQKYFARSLSNDQQHLVDTVLNNPETKFVHSRQYLLHLRNDLLAVPEDLWEAFAKRLIDSGGIVVSPTDTASLDDELVVLHNQCPENVLISLSYNYSLGKLLNTATLARLAKLKKPNVDWLIFELAAYHPKKITVKYSDFKRTADVDEYFQKIFTLARRISRLSIIDRNTSQFSHKKLDSVRGKVPIDYFTLEHSKFAKDEAGIRKYFQDLTLYATKQKRDLHGRRFIFESLVITSDHDLSQLIPKGSWELDVRFDPQSAREYISSHKARCSLKKVATPNKVH